LFKTLEELVKHIKENEIVPETFEKDNDENFHIDYIHAVTNLRADNYKI